MSRSSMTERGYTLVELLLAVVVGTMIIAATYVTYALISRQHQLISAFSNVRESGLPTLRILEQNLRMAGYIARDTELDPVFGTISQPVQITDSANACCDQLVITFDKDSTARAQVTYYVAPRSNPTRQALYMDVKHWDGISWLPITTGALVSDYVDDFQAEITGTASNGKPRQVDLSLTLRSKNALPETRTYAKSSYNIGNYNYSFTDNYYRDTVSATVYLRNVE